MSVVGLTFGNGREGDAADRRERGERRDQRQHARRRARALVPARSRSPARAVSTSTEASCQVIATSSPPQQRRALLRASARPPLAEHARGLGGELPAAAEHLGGRRVGDRPRPGPAARRARRSAPRTPCRASRRSPRRRRRRARAGARPARPCGRDPCRGSARRGRPRRRLAAVEHDLQREPLALAAGEVARMARRRARRARRLRAGRGELVADVLVRRGSRRGSAAAARRRPARSTRPRVGSIRPSAGAAASTCRPRCGPSARPSRPGAARGRRRAAPPARRDLVPEPGRAQRERVRRRRRPPRLAAAGTAPPRATRAMPRSSASRAALTDTGSGRSPARPKSVAAGVASAGSCASVQSRKLAGRAVEDDAPRSIATTRSAAGRQRSSRCSAISTAVPHSSLSRRSSQISSSPATGSSCEVGSSSSSSRGRAGERCGERDTLELAARERVEAAVEQALDPQRQRHLLDRARDGARRGAAVLERERELGADRVHDELRLRLLQDASRRPAAMSPGSCSRTSSPPTASSPQASPPWKCGTRPLAARSSVDLPDAERPASTVNEPGANSSVTSSQRGLRALGIAVAEAARARGPAQPRCHPRRAPRPANGSAPALTSASDERELGGAARHRRARVRLELADRRARASRSRAAPRQPRRGTRTSWRDHGRAHAAPGACRCRSRGARALRPRRRRGRARTASAARATAVRGAGRGAAARGLAHARGVAQREPGRGGWRATRSVPSDTRSGATARSSSSGSTIALNSPKAAISTSTRRAGDQTEQHRLERHIELVPEQLPSRRSTVSPF